MNKWAAKNKVILLSILLLLFLVGGYWLLNMQKEQTESQLEIEGPPILEKESKKSFEFFWDEANTDEGSTGYGLIRDRAPNNPELASIASVGFGLTAITIGAERNWITKEEAEKRIEGTLDTLLLHAEHENGVFYHFLNIDDATRAGTSEVSIIDTAILISGAITAGEYFEGDIKKKAEDIYRRVNWDWYRNPNNNLFYMSYSPESGFAGAWDFYAEQLMMYFLGAGSPTYPTNPEMFYDFTRQERAYGEGEPFIHSWFGSIFTHQFSHAWFDFRHYQDREGINWFENSIKASKANRDYVMDQADKFETFGPNAWGLTASDGPNGYNGKYGASPSGSNNSAHFTDGTIPPAGAAGSIVFTPEESIAALEHYETIPELWGDYGFKDAYNLEISPDWYAQDVIGIDKGITLLMIENYRTGFVWENFMKNEFVQKGIEEIGLEKVE
ncbi:glucoamylase family protein [Gracilibacillus sp. YIM 98692]|uniref:glucoamylase family protein n=1 Tax=Gracilibacillus sp. YIM 98692 TaxID=2663532 RepID=UPI001969E60E|nr:glucoamylase family protein [Gracilibacillus sp. YIM 98692]